MTARMLKASPARNVRPREADQVALLQAGELDYIWTYENLAALAGLRMVHLPHDVDLGTPADSTVYALAETRVVGARRGESLLVHGRPILFAVGIPTGASQPADAARFVAYLLSPEGRRILRRAHLDALDEPVIVGSGVPAAVRNAPLGAGPN
jgi:molybdate/tungstate transport system substrate-binding protein